MITNKIFTVVIAIAAVSCAEPQQEISLSDTEQWKLGWRMISSSWKSDHALAEKQFDSLLAVSDNIDHKFLVTGLDVLYELGKEEKLFGILNQQETDELLEICNSDLMTQKLKEVKACQNVESSIVKYPDLQIELIRMYVDDQAARGNLMEDIIKKYNIDREEVTSEDGVTVDARNRERLKEIFREYGFPTKDMIGKDAMFGIFLLIQHADGDKEWQKSQLSNIEKAVKRGDLDGQSYAYLYDRVKVNSGEKQLYGTQFSNVDPVNKTVTLAETENMDSLDYRRMEVGIMPIEMYKEIMFQNLQN